MLATVSWDGGGDDALWNDPLNWDTDTLPTAADDVVIDASGNVTITHDAGTTNIQSLVLADSLVISGGTLAVTNSLTATSATIEATGSGTSFAATGTTQIDSANLLARAGATLSLPSAVDYSHTTVAGYLDVTLSADGSGSLLDLPNLTTITGRDQYNSILLVETLNGGRVQMPLLSEIQVPASGSDWRRGVQLIADGSGSELDLPSLVTFVDAAHHANGSHSLIDALNGGSVLTPNLTTLAGVGIRSRVDGTVSISQLVSSSQPC